MKQLTLTVQACKKVTEKCKVKYRLGISFQDSIEIFKVRKLCVILIFEDIEIVTKTICGPPLKKGFDLYHKDLDAWIKKNNFCSYVKGKPTKLLFQIIEFKENEYTKIKYISKIKS